MRDKEARSRKAARRLRSEMTNAEVLLWSRLRRDALFGFRFRRQHPIGPYVVDFACVSLALVIEIDGATHSTDEERRYDFRREVHLREAGWRVIRFRNDDIYKNLDEVVATIAFAITPSGPNGPPPPQAGEENGPGRPSGD